MPQSSSRRHRKKPLHPRRVEITDEDGWTHVANTQILHLSSPSSSSSSKPHKRKTTSMTVATDGSNEEDQGKLPPLQPAEAPHRLNITDLQKQFATHLATWESSLAWQQLKSSFINDVLPKSGGRGDDLFENHISKDNSNLKIDNIVCIGLGSPSGFVQGGWVDRRSVALYQLAALVSIIECVKKHLQTAPEEGGEGEGEEQKNQQQQAKPLKVIAQDPVFNILDIQLFSSLGITVVNSPEGFNAVNSRTFLFAPGAERRHLQLMLPSNPAIVFGGPLEEEPSLAIYTDKNFHDGQTCSMTRSASKETTNIITHFASQTRSVKIAEFEPKPETFWRMRVYWRPAELEGSVDVNNER